MNCELRTAALIRLRTNEMTYKKETNRLHHRIHELKKFQKQLDAHICGFRDYTEGYLSDCEKGRQSIQQMHEQALREYDLRCGRQRKMVQMMSEFIEGITEPHDQIDCTYSTDATLEDDTGSECSDTTLESYDGDIYNDDTLTDQPMVVDDIAHVTNIDNVAGDTVSFEHIGEPAKPYVLSYDTENEAVSMVVFLRDSL